MNITIRVVKAQAESQIKALQGDIRALQTQLRSTSGGNFMDETGKSAQKLASTLRGAGYALVTTFTAPVVAAGRTLLQSFMDNEAAATDLAKVYGSDPTKNYNDAIVLLRKNFEALSTEYGVQQSQVIQIGADWAQAGVQGTALAMSVENTLKAMVIGGLSAADATQALIAIQAQYGTSAQGLTDTIATLNVVENQTGIDMGGLITGFSKAAGVAAQAGIDVRHLAAMLAALTPAAGSAAQAGNALKTIIDKILVPTAKASGFMEQFGINTASSAWTNQNATQRLEQMAVAFSKLDGQQKANVASAAANLYQINKFDILMKDMANYLNGTAGQLSYYGEALTATADPAKNAAIAQKELQTVLKSSPQMMKEVGAALKNQLTDIITPLIPTILSMADALLKLVTWFGNLNPNIQKFVGLAVLLMAALGPVLLYLAALRSAAEYFGAAINFLLKPLALFFGLFAGSEASAMAGTEAALGRINGQIAQLGAETGAAAETVAASNTVQARSWETLGTQILAVLGEIEISVRQTATIMTLLWEQTMTTMEAETAAGMGAMNLEIEAGMARNVIIMEGAAIESAAPLAIAGETAGAGFVGRFLGFFTGLPGKMMEILKGLPALIGRLFTELGPMLATMGEGLIGILTSPWTIAIAIILGLIYAFRDQIEGAWNALVSWFQGGAWGLVSAFSPVVSLFQKGIDEIKSAFYSLPAGVQGAMQAVVNIVEQAALAVYHLFSYLNPFAHHSPSLVENVTQGMAIVAAQFATVTNIHDPLIAAYNDVQTFGNAVAGLAVTARNLDIAKGLKDLVSQGASANAIAMYGQLQNDLTGLSAKAAALNAVIQQQQVVVDADKSAIDAANQSLSAQQTVLDQLTKTQSYWNDLISQAKDNITTFSQTGIVGQRAMSDQIFANTQAQKALQLQMMQIGDAAGGIDNVTNSLQAMAGQMLLLQGQKVDLRNQGAGSEITGQIDTQIAALTVQQSTVQQSAAAYNALSAQLTALQNQGQELDLENSLNFDGLTRQIDQAANALNELPFDQIMAGITSNQSALAGYTAQYNAATVAVTQQQNVVDSLTTARDALQATYDVENGKLQVLQDSYGKVNDAISAINQSLQTMSDNASKASDAAKGASSGGAGGGGIGSGDFAAVPSSGSLNSSDTTDGLQALTDAAIKNAQDAFGKIDFTKPLKKKWDEVKTWWGANVMPGLTEFGQNASAAFSNIDFGGALDKLGKTDFGKTLGSIGDTLKTLGAGLISAIGPDVSKAVDVLKDGFSDFAHNVLPQVMPLIKAVMNLFEALWPVIKMVIDVVAVLLVGAWKIAFNTIVGFLHPFLSTLSNIIGDVMQILTGLINFVADVLKGHWKAAWDDIVNIVTGVLTLIGNIIKGAFDIVLGTVEGFVKGIWGFFTWLYDELVGHSIIPDMIDAIVGLFTGLPGLIMGAIAGFGKMILDFFVGVGSDVVNWIAGWLGTVAAWFGQLPGRALSALSGLAGIVSNIFHSAFDWIGGYISGVGQTIYNVVSGIPGKILGLLGTFGSAGSQLAGAVWSGLSSFGGTIVDIGAKIKNTVNSAFGFPKDIGGWHVGVGPLDYTFPKIHLSGLAKGGPVFGPGTGTSDSVPMMLSRGEYVVNAAMAAKFNDVLVAINSGGNPMSVLNAMGAMGQMNSAGISNAVSSAVTRSNQVANKPVTGTITYSASNDNRTTINFHGDISLPNITDPADAAKFLENLETLAKGSM